MRIYLYLLAGITSALIGWNLGQFILTDLGFLTSFPEVVLFPCVAISLAMGMVLNEIFVSNPTRPKLSFRKAIIPLVIAFGLGLLVGLIAGGISQIIFLPGISISPYILRTLGWLLIGISVGLAEGLTWRWQGIEAGDRKRFWQRLTVSLFGGSIASLGAAGLFELIRDSFEQMQNWLEMMEDPLGFAILGLLLGLAFSITNSPSYQVALRAGSGFEYTGEIYDDDDITSSPAYPKIDRKLVTFISDPEEHKIEEGLSIRLPSRGKLTIGSSSEANIYIPGLPNRIADLELKSREAVLVPNSNYYSLIEVNGNRLGTRRSVRLKHNYLVTFHPKKQEGFNDEEKIYRFVYYNRFLDPQA